MPQFGSEALRESLAGRGIDYVHVPELGGRRRPLASSPNGGWRKESFRAYADHMASEEFERGLERLTSLASERPTAIMCAEAVWWRCHRRLIADVLLARGFEVRHIAGPGPAAPHELTDFARVEGTSLTYPPRQTALDE
jgi:uncharacterized protein (DUF488 family)